MFTHNLVVTLSHENEYVMILIYLYLRAPLERMQPKRWSFEFVLEYSSGSVVTLYMIIVLVHVEKWTATGTQSCFPGSLGTIWSVGCGNKV